MNNYDDLLPEEENNPVLIQNLQKRFELQSTDIQVLDHVHERLAHFSGTLPVVEQKAPTTSEHILYLHSRSGSLHNNKKIGRRGFQFNALAAVFIAALLISSLAFTFSAIHNHSNNSTATGAGGTYKIQLSVVIIPAQTHPAPTQRALQTTRDILYQRLVHDGFKDARVDLQMVHDKPQFEVTFFSATEETSQITPESTNSPKPSPTVPKIIIPEPQFPTLIQKGVLEFWGTGQQVLASGSTFDPQKYTQYNPDGLPQFDGTDLDAHTLGVSQDPYTHTFVINSELQKNAASNFEQYTASHIGDVLTITVDRKVIESAVIMSVVKGSLQIAGDFTQAQAEALVSVFKFGPLPVTFSKVPPYPYQLHMTPSIPK